MTIRKLKMFLISSIVFFIYPGLISSITWCLLLYFFPLFFVEVTGSRHHSGKDFPEVTHQSPFGQQILSFLLNHDTYWEKDFKTLLISFALRDSSIDCTSFIFFSHLTLLFCNTFCFALSFVFSFSFFFPM